MPAAAPESPLTVATPAVDRGLRGVTFAITEKPCVAECRDPNRAVMTSRLSDKDRGNETRVPIPPANTIALRAGAEAIRAG